MKTIRWILREIDWKRRNPQVCTWRRLVWSMFWWPNEDTPRWWTRVCFLLRRCWYVGRDQQCVCEGEDGKRCDHWFPAWWATDLCTCCGVEEDCCHGHGDEDASN